MTKYGIMFKPTNEYVSFYKDGKAVLFTPSENEINEELFNLLYTDGGYDGDPNDFSIVTVDTEKDGNELVKEDNIFVEKYIVDNYLKDNKTSEAVNDNNYVTKISDLTGIIDDYLHNKMPEYDYVLNYEKLNDTKYIIYVNNMRIPVDITDSVEYTLNKVYNVVKNKVYEVKESMNMDSRSGYMNKLESIIMDDLNINYIDFDYVYIDGNIYEVEVDGMLFLIDVEDDVYDNASMILEQIKLK